MFLSSFCNGGSRVVVDRSKLRRFGRSLNNIYMARTIDGMGRLGPEDNSVSFTPPTNLKLTGESGEALVKWKKSGDQIVITTMDGIALGSEEPSGAPEPAGDDSGAGGY